MKREIITDYPTAELEKKWLEFLPASNYPSHYTSPGFFKEPHWTNKNPFAVLVLDDEKIVAAATGLRTGKQIVSGFAVRPQVCIDERTDRKKICETLAKGFLEIAETDDGAERLVLNCPQRMPEFVEFGFKEKQASGGDEVVMLDLSRGADAVFKNFSQPRRSDLRKSMRENLVQVAKSKQKPNSPNFIKFTSIGATQNSFPPIRGKRCGRFSPTAIITGFSLPNTTGKLSPEVISAFPRMAFLNIRQIIQCPNFNICARTICLSGNQSNGLAMKILRATVWAARIFSCGVSAAKPSPVIATVSTGRF